MGVGLQHGEGTVWDVEVVLVERRGCRTHIWFEGIVVGTGRGVEGLHEDRAWGARCEWIGGGWVGQFELNGPDPGCAREGWEAYFRGSDSKSIGRSTDVKQEEREDKNYLLGEGGHFAEVASN